MYSFQLRTEQEIVHIDCGMSNLKSSMLTQSNPTWSPLISAHSFKRLTISWKEQALPLVAQLAQCTMG